MYLLIGKKNCNACKMAQTILKNKKIEFEYKLLEELSDEDRDFYINLARKQGKSAMPLIIKDNTIFTLQEVK